MVCGLLLLCSVHIDHVVTDIQKFAGIEMPYAVCIAYLNLDYSVLRQVLQSATVARAALALCGCRFTQPFVCKKCSPLARLSVYGQAVAFAVGGVVIVFFVLKNNLDGRKEHPSVPDMFKVRVVPRV